jgi:hypothetical protein
VQYWGLLMKKLALAITAAASIVLGQAIGAQAGPATLDNGGSDAPEQAPPPPALAGPNSPSGGGGGAPAQSPSFGGQAPQGAGISAPAPGSLPGADDPSPITDDAGGKN